MSNHSSEDIKEYHKYLEKMKADEEVNSKSRYNLFPTGSVDHVNMMIWIVYEILLNHSGDEKSVTQNKMAVYYHCMDIVKFIK